MKYQYKPKGICARNFEFEILDNKIVDLKIVGGCDGNLQGVVKLVQGRDIEEVMSLLKGIDCNGKGTSCPDQLSKALEGYLAEHKQSLSEDGFSLG